MALQKFSHPDEPDGPKHLDDILRDWHESNGQSSRTVIRLLCCYVLPNFLSALSSYFYCHHVAFIFPTHESRRPCTQLQCLFSNICDACMPNCLPKHPCLNFVFPAFLKGDPRPFQRDVLGHRMLWLEFYERVPFRSCSMPRSGTGVEDFCRGTSFSDLEYSGFEAIGVEWRTPGEQGNWGGGMEIRDCDAENLWRLNDVTHCKIEIWVKWMRINKCFRFVDKWNGVAIPNSEQDRNDNQNGQAYRSSIYHGLPSCYRCRSSSVEIWSSDRYLRSVCIGIPSRHYSNFQRQQWGLSNQRDFKAKKWKLQNKKECMLSILDGCQNKKMFTPISQPLSFSVNCGRFSFSRTNGEWQSKDMKVWYYFD